MEICNSYEEERTGKRLKMMEDEENEWTMESTSDFQTGQAGAIDKIVDDIRDYFRLEALDRIQNATRADDVCTDLDKLVQVNKADETVAVTALQRLSELYQLGSNSNDYGNGTNQEAGRQILESNGLELVLYCMEQHMPNATVQTAGCNVLKGMQRSAMVGYVEGEENKVLQVLASTRCLGALIGILERHQYNKEALGAAFFVLGEMEQTILKHGLPSETILTNEGWEPWSSMKVLLTTLDEKNALMRCFSLLERHPTDNTIVLGALTLMQQHVGGPHRPALHQLVANTPDFEQKLQQVVACCGGFDLQREFELLMTSLQMGF